MSILLSCGTSPNFCVGHRLTRAVINNASANSSRVWNRRSFTTNYTSGLHSQSIIYSNCSDRNLLRASNRDLEHNRAACGPHKRGDFFSHAQRLAGSAWVDYQRLFPVWDDDELRARHPYAESDWEHLPEHRCQHQRLNCEHHVSLSDCSH